MLDKFPRFAMLTGGPKSCNPNKETRRKKMGTHFINDDCINCGACVDVCPVEAISEGEDTPVIDRDVCTDCGACDEVCPVDAIKIG
jgi:ferredoxin